MLLTNHTLTGAAIALTLKQPALIVPVAFASHFILDSTPHFGGEDLDIRRPYPGSLRKLLQPLDARIAFTDCLVSLTVAVTCAYIWPQYFWALVAGIFFATLPDLLYILRYIMEIKFWEPLFRFHDRIQQHRWSETYWGSITEIIWASGMMYVLSGFLAR
jgi:hypothetical protein